MHAHTLKICDVKKGGCGKQAYMKYGLCKNWQCVRHLELFVKHMFVVLTLCFSPSDIIVFEERRPVVEIGKLSLRRVHSGGGV